MLTVDQSGSERYGQSTKQFILSEDALSSSLRSDHEGLSEKQSWRAACFGDGRRRRRIRHLVLRKPHVRTALEVVVDLDDSSLPARTVLRCDADIRTRLPRLVDHFSRIAAEPWVRTLRTASFVVVLCPSAL